MKAYRDMTRQELLLQQEELQGAYERFLKGTRTMNISRGKPSSLQLDAVSDLLNTVVSKEDCLAQGVDVRNYGELAGLRCAREYWADMLGCQPEETFVGGTASLNMMFDVISRAYSHGLARSEKPWCREETVKFLCPSPGYDRHFRITEFFGAELITVPMTPQGPDMDLVEQLVRDRAVKGIWCVPKYSNPDGIIYSDETLRRFATLQPAAPDFAIMWDNAYCVHEFEGAYVPFPSLLTMCKEFGTEHMVYEFASTSKITFAGGGMSVMAASRENIAHFSRMFSVQMISQDKVNQLRHVKYLKNKEHTLQIMQRHAKILAPKFYMLLSMLDREMTDCGIATWNRPTGGYFVSLNTMPGTAKRALQLCRDAGLEMTEAGATFPYGIDPQDSNIRIAPSYPPLVELYDAMLLFCDCLKLAALEKLLAEMS